MSIELHFTDEDWARIESAWVSWWAGELTRPMVVIEGKQVPASAELPEAHRFTSNFPLEMPAEEVIDRYQARLAVKRFHGDAWPKWWPNFGPGMLAGFLGSRVHCAPDTVWFEPAEHVNIEEARPAYDPENVWWRRVRELTRVAVERWQDRVSVGHTDLGGNLDIAASLRTTERLLLELHDAPEEVARLVSQITRLWLRYYEELYAVIRQAGRGTTPWAAIWSPGRCYMLQCDFSYMISPKMFERFVLPDIAACCEALDHGFYHLDGKGQIAHLDMLLSVQRLRGVQWVPGAGEPPADEWLPLLKRIRDAGKLCQLGVTPQSARTIVRELGGRGFAFHINQQMDQDEADGFLAVLADDDRAA